MIDREKVINGLECCVLRNPDDKSRCNECPYEGACLNQLKHDALALLKAQEPMKPKWQKGYAYCGQCGYKLHWIVDLNNFCPNCGQAVKWK